MDNEQARFILQACRPGGQDTNDPRLREALEQVKHDLSLAAWFEAERALDGAIAAKLKQAPVPADLKANIVAGRKVAQPAVGWRRREVLAAAAVVAFLLVLTGVWLPRNRSNRSVAFAAFHRDMTKFLDNIGYLEFQDQDMTKVKDWLSSRQGHGDLALPASLQGRPCVGCRVLDWHGRKVTLVCYYLKRHAGGQVEELHLLVIDRGTLRNPPAEGGPEFGVLDRWATASWSDHRHCYVLAGLAAGGYLKEYF